MKHGTFFSTFKSYFWAQVSPWSIVSVGRQSLTASFFSPPVPTYSLKTYKGVERNANLGEGGTFQSSILPQPHLEMPLWSNNKKGNIKILSRK